MTSPQSRRELRQAEVTTGSGAGGAATPRRRRVRSTGSDDGGAGIPGTAVKPDHFLPHIQGLRAIAVLLVVIYHFWPGRLTGGYIGVDVFFVISGFLITQQLTRQLERTDRIALPSFYAKRARRLLPAAIVVLIFSSLATLLIMPLSSLTENVREIFASTFYVENWVLAANSVDYLAASGDASLVQHYWSLSLEEQFYLFWPLLLIIGSIIGIRLMKRRGPALLVVLGVVGIASFVLSIVYTQSDPAPAYFVTFTRVWEFAAGAGLALLPRWRPTRAWTSNLVGYAGIVIVLGAGWFFNQSTPFPGYMAAIPVIGTAMIITAHHRERPWDAGRVLSYRPVSFVGDISYSLYLWHWPLIIIAPYIPGWGLSVWNRIALLLFCFVLAWLTKKFVEDPARGWRFLTSRRPRTTMMWVLGAMAVSSLVAGSAYAIQQPNYNAEAAQLQQTLENPPDCFGAASGPTNGLGPISPLCVNPALQGQIIPSPGFGNADQPSNTPCLTTLNDSTVNACQFGSTDPDAPQVALIGDSHAYALLDPFVDMATKNGWHLTTYLKGGCPWSTQPLDSADPLNAEDAFTKSCTDWRTNLTSALAAHTPFNAVFTAALVDRGVPDTIAGNQQLITGYTNAWQPVLAQGTPIVTIVDNPSWADDPGKCLRTEAESDCTEPRSEGLPAVDPIAVAAQQAKAQNQPVTLLDFSSTYCTDTTCSAVIGGANVYRDPDHLTRTFALTLEQFLDPVMSAVIGK
jgi:peptidoglycan/LPS O-acetylase OafA/YrhL